MTRKEALIKALVWRFCVSIPSSFTIIFLFTGHIIGSLTVVVTLNIVQTIFHYFFELFWARKIIDSRQKKHQLTDHSDQ